MPLPESYLDVPPSGEAYFHTLSDIDVKPMTRKQAIDKAAAANRETIAAVGRSLKDADRDWSVVVELGASYPEHNVGIEKGAGVLETKFISPACIVVPTEAEREEERISWDGLIEAREGSAYSEPTTYPLANE